MARVEDGVQDRGDGAPDPGLLSVAGESAIHHISLPQGRPPPLRDKHCHRARPYPDLDAQKASRMVPLRAAIDGADDCHGRCGAGQGPCRSDSTLGEAGLLSHNVLRAGVPLNLIQVVAKHKYLETLLIYLPRSEVSLALGLPSATQCL